MCNFSIQTDHVTEARRPDLVVVDKKERSWKIIAFAVRGDRRIEVTEQDKIEKYLGKRVTESAIPKQFGNRLKQIGITVGTAQVQKTVLLGTARTL